MKRWKALFTAIIINAALFPQIQAANRAGSDRNALARDILSIPKSLPSSWRLPFAQFLTSQDNPYQSLRTLAANLQEPPSFKKTPASIDLQARELFNQYAAKIKADATFDPTDIAGRLGILHAVASNKIDRFHLGQAVRLDPFKDGYTRAQMEVPSNDRRDHIRRWILRTAEQFDSWSLQESPQADPVMDDHGRTIKIKNDADEFEELSPADFQHRFKVTYTPYLLFSNDLPPQFFRDQNIASSIAAPHPKPIEAASLYIAKVDPDIGYGLFAGQNLNAGDIIGEFTGVLRPWSPMEHAQITRNHEFMMMYDALEGYFLDATNVGNELRFANHSSKYPNATLETITRDGIRRLVLVANTFLMEGWQVLFHYGYTYWGNRQQLDLHPIPYI